MTYVTPGIGTSLFLITAGAILRYAVTAVVSGVALKTVGLIRMVVGAVGLAISLVFLFMRFAGSSRTTRTSPPERVVEPRHYYDE
jgi:hypothetical protein